MSDTIPGSTTAEAAARTRRPHAVFHPLRVAAVERLTDDAVAVTFDVPDELREDFRFRPGQHVSVRAAELGEDVRRNYSICSAATSGRLRIGVKRVPEGVFSSYVAQKLSAGDVLDVMTPSGSFSTDLRPDQAKRYVAVAAGSGITPVLSILSTALEVEPESTAALIYVNRNTPNIMFLEELEDLKNAHPTRFELLHVLGSEPQDVDLFSGRLDPDRLSRILDSLVPVEDVDDWFLCGPLALTETVRDVLLERGVDSGHVHRELFYVGTPVAKPRPVTDGEPVSGATVTVLLDGRAQRFTLPSDGESILDATLRGRADAPFACKNAVCGTCRAKVTKGRVEMDANYALEPEEVAAGFVLTCQAHPVTDEVEVDFDA
jgi:ring-1,2-phenylacetyl-CoA epoxidase subunit PaaE